MALITNSCFLCVVLNIFILQILDIFKYQRESIAPKVGHNLAMPPISCIKGRARAGITQSGRLCRPALAGSLAVHENSLPFLAYLTITLLRYQPYPHTHTPFPYTPNLSRHTHIHTVHSTQIFLIFIFFVISLSILNSIFF